MRSRTARSTRSSGSAACRPPRSPISPPRRASRYGPLYVKSTIAAGSYSGQDKPSANIDVWNILVTNDKMSDEMAYNIVKTLVEKKADLVAVHKEAENIDLKNQAVG